MKIQIKKVTALFLTAALTMTVLTGCGENEKSYPDSNINLVVSASAGGDTDTYARILAQHLEKELDRKSVV